MFNIVSSIEMSQEIWNQIQVVIQVSIRALLDEIANSFESLESFESFDNDDDILTKEFRLVLIKSTKNIDYFDFAYENLIYTNVSIINVERHVFYRDVYVFIDRLKNLAKDFVDEQKVKKLILDCLRDASLI